MKLTDEVREEIEAIDQLLTANPLEGYNNPELNKLFQALGGKTKPLHKKQLALHRRQGNGLKRVYLGGNRGGKTTGGVVDDLIQALPEELIGDHLKPFKFWQPPFYCRIITPDFTRTMAAVYEVIRRWCPPAALVGGSWEKAFNKQDRILSFASGSFFEFMTYEQDVDKFGGTARHRIHYDEEPPGEKGELVRTECRLRLVDYNGDELFSFTPLLGLTWTFDEFWEQKGPETEKDVWEGENLVVIRADMDDNPHLSEEGKRIALEGLPEAVREARKSGNFAHFKGLVYSEFDPDVHLCDPPTASHLKGQTVVVGIDPGIDTTGVLFGAFDRDNQFLIFDELYLSGEDAIPANASKRIKLLTKRWGVKVDYFVIDPSARNRNLVNADRVETAYAREGIFCRHGQNDLEAGVFEMKRRFEQNAILISRDCEKWRWEASRYRLDHRTDGTFAVVRRNNHLQDCARYMAMSRVWSSPEPRKKRPPGYQPDFQPPYQSPKPETPPLGAFS